MEASTALIQNCRTTALLAVLAANLMATQDVQAQTYTVVELSPSSPVSVANTISTGVAAGNTAYPVSPTYQRSHATIWDGSAQTDLHPAFLDDAVNGIFGTSAVLGSTETLQVGWGYGPTLQNRYVPVAWNGTVDSARRLALPFTNAGGQALATDGSQIVGYGTGLNKDGTTIGPAHAVVWDGATGQAVDLGDAGNGAQALGVGGGQQVGYVIKSTQNAALWRGSANSLVVLHPKGAVSSAASGTDGAYQVGFRIWPGINSLDRSGVQTLVCPLDRPAQTKVCTPVCFSPLTKSGS
jgi:hypothetical protein